MEGFIFGILRYCPCVKKNYAFLLLAVALALKRADRFADLSKSDLRSNDKTITELGYRKIQ